ncbi:hypothetical protein SLE2022_157830 [Rubroshorea leprosula]
MGVDVIGDGVDVSSDPVHLMKDMVSNSNVKTATGRERWKQSETEREFEGDERHGHAKDHGPQRVSSVGPEKRNGSDKSNKHGRTKEMSIEGPSLNTQNPEVVSNSQKPENRASSSKKQRLL